MYKKLERFWYNIPDKIRFVLVGGFNAGVSYLIYASLLYFLLGEKYYQLSLALAWILSSVISFSTQRNLVFRAKGNIIHQYIKCCVTWFFSYLINAFLLWILVQKLYANVYLGQIIATAGCAIFTYIIFKIFAFKPMPLYKLDDNKEN